jgi:GntR family transcriptional regulator, vanillate catabolism transcriptional regulator
MAKQGQHVLSTLRQKIISGDYGAGERLAEIPTAEQLGVSRMPVRIAFRTLEQEGLLTKLPGRGYSVREMTADEINGAVEVRGVLEGLAACQVAQRGLSASQRELIQTCLTLGDALFDKGFVTEEDLEVYHDLNKRFHGVIIEASGNPAIAAALVRGEHLPFASVSALAVDCDRLDLEYRRFNYAHLQHHAVFDAIEQGHGVRAEAIMREHANATLRYAAMFGASSGEEGSVRVIGVDGPQELLSSI